MKRVPEFTILHWKFLQAILFKSCDLISAVFFDDLEVYAIYVKMTDYKHVIEMISGA